MLIELSPNVLHVALVTCVSCGNVFNQLHFDKCVRAKQNLGRLCRQSYCFCIILYVHVNVLYTVARTLATV